VAVIETQQLVKTYGSVEALKGVSIRVEPGEIYGLLGQNGAGKTTLIKVLLGLVRKTAGDAALLGEPAGTVDVRQKVGYLPEDHRFPEYHTAYSLMDFYGQLYGLPRDERRLRRCRELHGQQHRVPERRVRARDHHVPRRRRRLRRRRELHRFGRRLPGGRRATEHAPMPRRHRRLRRCRELRRLDRHLSRRCVGARRHDVQRQQQLHRR